MIKVLTYTCVIALITLTSCRISGTYRWAKLNTKLNTELIEKLDSIDSDSNLKYYRYDVFELRFKSFGNMKYRFTKRLTEGGVSFVQDLPLNSGKYEISNDTLSIYYSLEKEDTPYLYKITRDTLIPINNRTCWVKEK